MTLPLTIALTTYNRAPWLGKAIQGILDQTFEDFELLILDRGSTDATPEVILGFKDPRIRYVRNPPGTSREFNGMATNVIGRGEYILIAHDDDIFLPDLARRQFGMLAAHPGMTAVGANMHLMNESGEDVGTTLYPGTEDRVYGPGEYVRNVLEDRIWILVSGLMYRRRLIPAAAVQELYYGVVRKRKSKETRDATSEMNLLTYMNRKAPIGFLGEPLIRYRQHSGQDSRTYDVFRPIIDTVIGLKGAARHNRLGPETLGILEAFLQRYRLQATLGQWRDRKPSPSTLRKIRNGKPKLEQLAADLPARNALLPAGILMSQLGLSPDPALWSRGAEEAGALGNVATRALMAWMVSRQAGRNLFGPYPGLRRIAIFGSVFVASLLILEARERGLDVVCCLDSNPSRQGSSLLGVPIFPLGWLAEKGRGVDGIVISSEKDHLNLFRSILAEAGGDASKVVSWLEMVPRIAGEARAVGSPG
ncbi:glycosyltransferase family 2 protein [Mesoterricola silvestris]|uniref:Glycosyltransferase 2-like domain-containing protein n=1 Tax=Mesoterricola silvestris TaxID=2927979 RepID=A0AA48K7C3_9BACT|nr:glycosyltransferase [Mesoterricola silvestris]BDU71015.1 hypothetical protein METEAL_01890 [Mesoterricola silvestris]